LTFVFFTLEEWGKMKKKTKNNKSIWCKLGFHKNKDVSHQYSIHKYYICKKCGKKKLILSASCYQPIREDFEEFRPN